MGKKYYGNMEYIPKYPDFKDPDVWQDLKRQCYDGTIDYSSFPAAEYKYFDKLRLTYLEYKFNGLSVEAAAARERRLYKEYLEAKKTEADAYEVYGTYQDSIKLVSGLKIKINKSGDLPDMLESALKAVGLLTNDKIFEKANLRKIAEGSKRNDKK